MNGDLKGDLYELTEDFKALTGTGKREVLKTARNLLEIQTGNRTLIAGLSPLPKPNPGQSPVWVRGITP